VQPWPNSSSGPSPIRDGFAKIVQERNRDPGPKIGFDDPTADPSGRTWPGGPPPVANWFLTQEFSMPGLRTRSALIASLSICTLAAGQGADGSAAGAKPAQPAAAPAGQPAQVAPSGVTPEAKDRFDNATKALEEANALSFKIAAIQPKFQGGGLDLQPRFDGVVEMQRRADGPGWLTRREGTGQMGEPLSYLVVSDGQVVSWIDHDKKTVFEKFTRSARDKQIQSADSAWIKQLTESQPFAKELTAAKATLNGTADADGTPCDIVTVEMGPNKETLTWYFAAADHLPRRLVRLIGPFETTFELTDVKVNPDLAPERFVLETPEGYKRDAVVRPTARPNPEPGEASSPVVPPRPRPVPGDSDAPPALRAAPAFELQSTEGKAVSLESLKGNVVVLGFWGAWQPGGRMAAPEFQSLADSYKGQPVRVLWLARKGKEPQGVLDFVQEHGLTMGVLVDADAVAKEYQVRSYPGFAVVGTDGQILHQSGGFVAGETMAEIKSAIDRHLSGEDDAGDDAAAPAPGTGNVPGGPSR
jgi:peroxiredoxin/outer membrane lipoprotein-sorting protein